MKKLLFFLFGLLVVIFAIPVQRGAAETPDPTPVPDALVAEALAAKQASYPAWVGDEMGYMNASPASLDFETSAPETPSSLSDWVMTVMQLYIEGNWEIYAFYNYNYPVHKFRLTNNPGSDIWPTLNFGATQIVFATNRDGNYELYRMGIDGNALERLTVNEAVDSQPAWSFDGTQIVFTSDRDGNAEIYKMQADGSEQVRLTYDEVTDFSPTWSPDGTKLGFLKVSGYGASVWIMDADGSNPHPISAVYPYTQHLRWSPDGTWLTFDGDVTGDGWNEKVILHPDGTDFQQILFPGSYLLDQWVTGWTPDSQELLANAVTYTVIDGQLYIYDVGSGRVGLNGSNGSLGGITYNYDMLHSSQRTDIGLPYTALEPLPKFSKVSGFSMGWNAQDLGPAGIWYVDLDLRHGLGGAWENWFELTYPSGRMDYTGAPGETVYFRGRAVDNAENIEPWPSVGWNTFTTFYSWALNGLVTDNRGIGLPLAQVGVTPQALNTDASHLDGSFLRYNAVTTTTWTVDTTGYEPALSTQVLGDEDQAYFWALSPSDNQILNDDFETGDLNFWEIDGSMPAFWDNHMYHTGIGSGRIGRKFLSEQSINISNTSDMSAGPQIAKTLDGVLHAVWSDATPINGNQTIDSDIFYSFKTTDGEWSSPSIVAPIHAYSANSPQLITGPDGTLHVVWLNTSSGGSNISYASKPLGGEWSAGEVIGELPFFSPSYNAPKMALDSLGGVHVTWCDGYGFHYVYKPADEAWLSPELLGNYVGIPHNIVVTSNDMVYVFYATEGALREIHKSLGGAWTSEEILFPNVESFMMTLNGIDGLSVLWKQQDKIYLANSDENINWSTPTLVASQGLPIELKAFERSEAGETYVSWMAVENNQYHAYLRLGYSNGTWSGIVPMAKNYNNSFGMDILPESDGSFHAVWSSLPTLNETDFTLIEIYYEKISWPQSEQGALSQVVSLPSTMNKPTLSFAYLLNVSASNGENSEFEVQINHQSVYSTTTETSNWSYIWLDLSPWISETITVTFQATSYSTEGFESVYLDDITVSSWLTPVPLAVDLPHLPPFNAPTQITITGENFLEGATVRLNDTPLQNIQWLDENTLQATIPANLPPGRYHLWVTNPGGQASVLAYAVSAGNIIFIPVLRR